LRIAGALTQLTCGACLLIGTIGMVLVQQNKAGGVGATAAWLLMALAGLVFGGLIYRGGLVSMLVAAAIDAGFGFVLVTFEDDRLRKLLKILPAPDVALIGGVLAIAGFAMIGTAAICLIALPQGLRYARWFRDAAATRSAMSTARGFPPPPVPARSSAYIIPAEEQPASRQRLYIALGGLAIGVGAGIGVLVSSTKGTNPAPGGTAVVAAGSGSGSGTGTGTGRPSPGSAAQHPAIGVPSVESRPASGARSDVSHAPTGAGLEATRLAIDAGVGLGDAGATSEGSASGVTIRPLGTVGDLVIAQRAAIARADGKALASLIAPGAFGFGVDADEVADGRDAVVAQLAHDLGTPPPGGFTVESKALAIGEDRGHAWIAEQLEIGGGRRASRSFAVTELAAMIDGSWQIVALHWANPVDDTTAERLVTLGRLPTPRPIADHHDSSAELDQAVRAAFASRAAFAEARSERADAFNYGSGGERAHGGAAIKRIFARLKAELQIHDGARVVGGSAWDPAQNTEPWIGWAALNVDFTAKASATTDVTQTFRVLAILIKEADGWKIVQTQWSNGGPIR
jgi:hypothetical protein